jgi:hypothetical protein
VAAFVIASSGSTARADTGPGSNIPGAAAKSHPAPGGDLAPSAPDELPLPYQPWQGSSFGPPPTHSAIVNDSPLPFARSPELRRRPYELTLSPSVFLPGCGDGSIDGRGCASVALGSGVEAALLYRVVPFFAVGVEGLLAGFGGAGHGALSSIGGDARFFGVVGRAYFADNGPWDPYASLSIGYGELELAGAGTTSGWGGRIAGGIDYLLGSHLRVGPTLGFAHLLVWEEEQCQGGSCSERPLPYGRLLAFTTLGVRLSGSFGQAL